MFKLSIDGYSFHGEMDEGRMDIFHYFETVRYRYGIGAVGIWNGFLKSLDEDYLKNVKRALDDRELALPNIALDWVAAWDDNPGTRKEYREKVLQNIKAAAFLGAKSVRLDWGVREKTLTNEQFDGIASAYREYCSIAQDMGMVLGPENHYGASLDPKTMVKMAEAINHPAYKILLHLGRHPIEEEKMLAPYAIHTHVGPYKDEKEAIERINSLADTGFNGYWGIEYGPVRQEFATVEHLVAWLKLVLKRYHAEKAAK